MAIVNLTPDSFSGDGHLSTTAGHLSATAGHLSTTAGHLSTTAAHLSTTAAHLGQPATHQPAAPAANPGLRSPSGLLHPGPAAAKLAIAAAMEALDNGADIVDLGAESTRPNATPISSDEEQARLLPVLDGVLRERPHAVLSVDTYHADTARLAARAGAEIINDVSGLGWDSDMAAVAAQSGCGLVLMHTRGRPREWLAQGPMTRDEVLPSVFAGLCEALAIAESAGIATERIVLDPGFGFGKRGHENFVLLAGLGRLRELDRPLLIGLSRKGFLGEAVAAVQPPGLSIAESRRIATVAANVAAVLAGAHILRVHDLQAAREAVAIADTLLNSNG
jgi:dihydropteroate synthase